MSRKKRVVMWALILGLGLVFPLGLSRASYAARTIERVSVDDNGNEGNGDSFSSSITPGGRYLTFESLASNLVPDDTNEVQDIFVYDRTLDTIERVSVDNSGNEGNGESWYPRISSDGRYVAFNSFASNLVPGDTNGVCDIFVYVRTLDTNERVRVDNDGTEGNGNSDWASISPDGRYVAFASEASNLVPGDTNGVGDIFVSIEMEKWAIDIDPDTLNLNSKNKWVTTYIELPEGYDVNDINVSTILLEDAIPAKLHPTKIGDHDNDGIPDLRVKFDRSEVQAILEPGEEVEITVTGELYDGTPFEGSDTIRVIDKGKK